MHPSTGPQTSDKKAVQIELLFEHSFHSMLASTLYRLLHMCVAAALAQQQ